MLLRFLHVSRPLHSRILYTYISLYRSTCLSLITNWFQVYTLIFVLFNLSVDSFVILSTVLVPTHRCTLTLSKSKVYFEIRFVGFFFIFIFSFLSLSLNLLLLTTSKRERESNDCKITNE